MPQVIRVKRNATSAAVPATLDPGELAVNIFPSSPTNLYVGSDTNTVLNLVNPNRQVELTGDQGPIAGNKTFAGTGMVTVPVANLKVSGGAAGNGLVTDGAGNLTFAPMVSASQQFVGQFTGATGVVSFTADSGGTGPGLPAPGPANDGWYVICNVAGATPPAGAGAGVVGPFDQGDWIISNGTAWTHLDFGGVAVSTASEVGVAAPLTGPTVQDELEAIQVAAGNFVSGPAASTDNGIAVYDGLTGLLIKDSTTLISSLATVTYVDAENAAQDLIIAANAAFVAAQPGIDAGQDAAIAAAGDVKGPASVTADGNIAVYNLLTGKLIKDGGTTIAQLQTDIAAAGDVYGPAASVLDRIATYADATGKVIKDGGILVSDVALATDLVGMGDVVGPAISVLDRIATYSDATGKLIKDSGQTIADVIASIPGAQPPLVTAPELIGDGTLGNEITFTGITIAANSTASFTGNGLAGATVVGGAPLDLILVDGGTYT
jgi:hypothetical protein